jgi:methylenetetrahydrofolate dehydrogenase (NADP+)/methenyltetrahydrofolate cyclohydrolase
LSENYFSIISGEPVGLLCKSRGATVTFCTVQTRNLQDYFLNADVIISATGHPHLIHGDLLPPLTNRPLVIVDAGVSSKPPIIQGDVHIESVRKKCTLITPPTGAVGKMTIAALAYNLYSAYKLQNQSLSEIDLYQTAFATPACAVELGSKG